VEGRAAVPATKDHVEQARNLGDARIPNQRQPYAKEAHPVREIPAPRGPSAARWVIPGIGGTAIVAAGTWLVVLPLLYSSSGTTSPQVADCVPQRDLFDVQVGMTRQSVLNTFSSAGHIDQYTPRHRLAVVYRSCARTAPWTRLMWVTYVWEDSEWRVAELHKGLGIVDAP
jgi:hypothetical protein